MLLVMNSQLWIIPTVASRSSSSVMESKSFQASIILLLSHVIDHTYRSLVAQWMKNVQSSGVTLFAAPDKVNPSRQICADVVTLQRLGYGQCYRAEKAGNSIYSAIHNYEEERIILCPWG